MGLFECLVFGWRCPPPPHFFVVSLYMTLSIIKKKNRIHWKYFGQNKTILFCCHFSCLLVVFFGFFWVVQREPRFLASFDRVCSCFYLSFFDHTF